MGKLTELQKRVIEQLSGESELNKDNASILKAVSNNGADRGFNGFISYNETCKFFDDNKDLIMEQLLEDRANTGYNLLTEMLSSFKCFKDVDTCDIEAFLINSEDESNEEQTTLKNGLAWYALESVAWQLEEQIEGIIDSIEWAK